MIYVQKLFDYFLSLFKSGLSICLIEGGVASLSVTMKGCGTCICLSKEGVDVVLVLIKEEYGGCISLCPQKSTPSVPYL